MDDTVGEKVVTLFSEPRDWSRVPDDKIPYEIFDIETALRERGIPVRSRKPSRLFAGGKIYLDWVRRCWEAHPAALPLALAIRARKGRYAVDEGWVPITNDLGELVGINSTARRRALAALEKAGIVRVEQRGPGKSTLAQLIDCDD